MSGSKANWVSVGLTCGHEKRLLALHPAPPFQAILHPMNAFSLRPRLWLIRYAPIAISAGLIFFAGLSPARGASWKDAKGATFTGDPLEVLGPWALFKTGPLSGRRVFLHTLSPTDCQRVYHDVSSWPSPAAKWSEATGAVTKDVIGHVLQLKGKTLVPADLTGMPEPELVLLLIGSHNDSEGWEMVSNMMPIHQRIQRAFPGLMGTVFLGIRHNNQEHQDMAVQAAMPWLIANYPDESAMGELKRYIPSEGTNMVLLSREGVPLIAARATDRDAMRQFIDQLSDLVSMINPLDPRGWKDRISYFSTIRPVAFAQSRAEPLLIGSPLRAAGLRKYGVTRINAHFDVTADGKVTPTLRSTAAEVPPPLVAPLTEALRQTAILPAIDHGVAVAGVLDYILEVPPPNREVDADLAWLGSSAYPDVPIDQWLLLRPIKVSELDFTSTVEGETPTGTVVFKALQVSDAKVSRAAQMNAFNSDWFGEGGAATVLPKEGDKQTVDGTTLTWQRVKSNKGFVNMQSGPINIDYTVGYATAEFEVPAAVDAWLGIGSDDGLKIWLNGEMVHDKWIRRQSRIDDDAVPLHLKAGKNRILIKIQNATIDWSFLYRLRTAPH